MAKYMSAALLSVAWISSGGVSFARECEFISGDKDLQLKVDVKDRIFYSVVHKSKPLLKPSPISLRLNRDRFLGAGPQVLAVRRRSVDEKIHPVFMEEVTFDFAAKYGVEYIILDKGWSVLGALTKVVEG